MLTAILSARKQSESGELRALLQIAGRSVLEWQSGHMRSIGCQRFICLCESTPEPLLEIQRALERQDCEFYAVRSSMQLAALLRSDEQICFMADGLWVDGEAFAKAVMKEGSPVRTILTLDANHMISTEHPDDFERIDAERRWAGYAMVPATLAQKLTDLPPDGDALSLLLRLCLQRRIETRQLNLDEIEEGGWTIVADGSAARSIERALIDGVPGDELALRPFERAAFLIVRSLAPRGLAKGRNLAAISALAALLASIVAGFQGFVLVAMALLILGALGHAFASGWGQLVGELGYGENGQLYRFINALTDMLIALSLAASILSQDTQNALLALPLMLVGMTRISASISGQSSLAIWTDRTLYLVLLAVPAAFGFLPEAIAVLGLMIMAHILIRVSRAGDNAALTIDK